MRIVFTTEPESIRNAIKASAHLPVHLTADPTGEALALQAVIDTLGNSWSVIDHPDEPIVTVRAQPAHDEYGSIVEIRASVTKGTSKLVVSTTAGRESALFGYSPDPEQRIRQFGRSIASQLDEALQKALLLTVGQSAQCVSTIDVAMVRGAVGAALAMAWDGCHKIYLLMDEDQVKLEESYGRGTIPPDYDTLVDWYQASCGMRFVSAVRTVEDNPNDGYTSLIPQCAGDYPGPSALKLFGNTHGRATE